MLVALHSVVSGLNHSGKRIDNRGITVKKSWFALLAVCLLGSTSASMAGDFKPYIGLAAGTFNLKYSQNHGANSAGLNEWTVGGFLKGGVDYGDYIGLELRIGMTGRTHNTVAANTNANPLPVKLTIGADTFVSYLIKPQYPFMERYRLYGLLGGTAANFHLYGDGRGVGVSSSKVKTGFTYGLGLEYQFRLNGSLGIEWVEYWSDVPMQVSPSFASKASIRGLSVMVNKSF